MQEHGRRFRNIQMTGKSPDRYGGSFIVKISFTDNYGALAIIVKQLYTPFEIACFAGAVVMDWEALKVLPSSSKNNPLATVRTLLVSSLSVIMVGCRKRSERERFCFAVFPWRTVSHGDMVVARLTLFVRVSSSLKAQRSLERQLEKKLMDRLKIFPVAIFGPGTPLYVRVFCLNSVWERGLPKCDKSKDYNSGNSNLAIFVVWQTSIQPNLLSM